MDLGMWQKIGKVFRRFAGKSLMGGTNCGANEAVAFCPFKLDVAVGARPAPQGAADCQPWPNPFLA
jgi:hypothetical protein